MTQVRGTVYRRDSPADLSHLELQDSRVLNGAARRLDRFGLIAWRLDLGDRPDAAVPVYRGLRQPGRCGPFLARTSAVGARAQGILHRDYCSPTKFGQSPSVWRTTRRAEVRQGSRCKGQVKGQCDRPVPNDIDGCPAQQLPVSTGTRRKAGSPSSTGRSLPSPRRGSGPPGAGNTRRALDRTPETAGVRPMSHRIWARGNGVSRPIHSHHIFSELERARRARQLTRRECALVSARGFVVPAGAWNTMPSQLCQVRRCPIHIPLGASGSPQDGARASSPQAEGFLDTSHV